MIKCDEHTWLISNFRAVEISCMTCPTWSNFIQDKLKISIYLSLNKYKCIKLIKFCISVFIFWLIITSSHLALKTVWILISWLLKKPADLDLHCLQEKPADQDPNCLQELIYIWFHTVFERINWLSTVRYKLICSFGQVKFSMGKYILAFYLSLDK